MKTKFKVIFSLFILIGMILSSSCVKDKFDEPVITPPVGIAPTSGLTIQKLLGYYSSFKYVDSVYEIREFPNDSNFVLNAYVVSSDRTGNFYKELYVQDETGGIKLSIDGSNLFNDYTVGQKVQIKLNDLYVHYETGAYKSSMLEIGYGKYTDTHGEKIGRIPVTILSQYLVKDGSPIEITPVEIDLNSMNDNNIGRLVIIKNAQFINSDTNATYADAAGHTNQNLHIEACNKDNTILIRTSGYATFAGTNVPTGNGDITAVLAKYGDDYQIMINSTDDVLFTNARCDGGGGSNPGTGTGSGTFDDPYDVEAAISENNSATSVWVTGFLVGVMETGGTDFVADLVAPFTTGTNVFIAASENETDTAKMIIIKLPSGEIRDTTNLVDNGNLLGSEIMYHGDLMDYFSAPGMQNTNGYWLNGTGINPDLPASIVIKGTSQIVDSLNETFDNSTPNEDFALNGWLNANKQGERYWIGKEYTDENNKYLQFSGYQATYSNLESWLVTPGVNATTAKKLSFRTKTGYYKHDALTVFVSTDFDGNNSNLFTSTWTDITSSATIATGPSDAYGTWVVSGDIDLSAYTGTIYVMFKYTGDNSTNTTTMQLDDVIITDL